VPEQEHQQAVVIDALGADHLAIFVIDILLDALDRALEGDILDRAAGILDKLVDELIRGFVWRTSCGRNDRSD
jgi:hypothetical protein